MSGEAVESRSSGYRGRGDAATTSPGAADRRVGEIWAPQKPTCNDQDSDAHMTKSYRGIAQAVISPEEKARIDSTIEKTSRFLVGDANDADKHESSCIRRGPSQSCWSTMRGAIVAALIAGRRVASRAAPPSTAIVPR